MEEKRILIARMVKSIKAFIALSDEKGLEYNKSELTKLIEWGNCILENNLGESSVNRFIKFYNLFKRSIASKNINEKNKMDNNATITGVFDTNESKFNDNNQRDEEVIYQLDLEKVKGHLNYFQEELDIMGITFLLDKDKWGNTKNYYEFLTSYEKMKVLLKGFSATICEYDNAIVQGVEGKALVNALRATRDCLATLILLSDKILDKTEWKMEEYKKTYKAFSDAIVDYMIINYLNNQNLVKRI